MKNKLSVLFAGLLCLVYISPAQADSIIQLWTCSLNDGKTRTELMEVSAVWMKAAKTMTGGEEFEAYIEYPLAADDVDAFTFVLVAKSAATWGAFQDAYVGSAAEKADEAWNNVADCSDSSLWSSVKIE